MNAVTTALRTSAPLQLALLAGFVGIVVALQTDATGRGWGWTGPGLTIDESFNVQQGVYLVQEPLRYGLGLLSPGSWLDIFADQDTAPGHPYLPDHPPLGRLWLGLHHELARPLLAPAGSGRIVYSLGRLGSATAFAVTLWLVGLMAWRQGGLVAGFAAMFALATMTRVFGHAHLAALETVTNLAWTLAIFTLLSVTREATPPKFRQVAWAGLFLGLALLTKIQGVLLIPPVFVWMVWRWRLAGLRPFAVWLGAGLVTMFVLWPWLWHDPYGHFLQYLGRTTNRIELSVWYLGRHYADRAVPWHYPVVITFATVHIITLLFGSISLWLALRGRTLPWNTESPAPKYAGTEQELIWANRLSACTFLFPLMLFSMPNIAVYDGERLFLIAFPTFGVLSGLFTADAYRQLGPRLRWCIAVLALGVLFDSSGNGPVWLSAYAPQIGGNRGALSRGLETNYWADSLTSRFWHNVALTVPRDEVIVAAPTLHQFQLNDWKSEVAVLRDGPRLVASDSPEATAARWVVLFARRADLPPHYRKLLDEGQPKAAVRRGGVLLGGLYELHASDRP